MHIISDFICVCVCVCVCVCECFSITNLYTKPVERNNDFFKKT